jgi:hypothetical protein
MLDRSGLCATPNLWEMKSAATQSQHVTTGFSILSQNLIKRLSNCSSIVKVSILCIQLLRNSGNHEQRLLDLLSCPID